MEFVQLGQESRHQIRKRERNVSITTNDPCTKLVACTRAIQFGIFSIIHNIP